MCPFLLIQTKEGVGLWVNIIPLYCSYPLATVSTLWSYPGGMFEFYGVLDW